jgi:hypothetical protein
MAINNINDPNDTLILDYTGKAIAEENLVPELQNQVPYVELVVYRNKVADYVVADDGTIKEYNTQSAVAIPLMGYDENTKVYEDNFESDSEVFQNFGISSIDINVKSKFIPTVKIKFIDVKGQSAFNTDNKTNNAGYRSLFDFPPATYVLKVKGVFGNIVRYDLHLLKTDSTFNASNGNFEISCEFVGKSFVPLTDIKLGWIKAVSRINNPNPDSTNTNNGSQVNNFQDLIYQTTHMYNDIRELVNGSKETDKLKTDRASLNLCVSFQDDLLKRYGGTFNKTNGNLIKINNNKSTTIENIYTTTKEGNESFVVSGKTYEELYALSYISTVTVETTFLTTLFIEFETYKRNIFIYNKDKYKDLNITILDTDIELFYTKTENGDETTFTVYYNYTEVNKKIIAKSLELTSSLTKNSTDLDNKINDIVLNTVGFELKIKNVFDIVMSDASKFLKYLKESGDVSENRKAIVNSNNRSIKQDVPLVAYPRVINSMNETIYPGDIPQFKDWKEVKFVESFLDAYLNTLRQDKELEDSIANTDDTPRQYIPIGTQDFNSLKYSSVSDIDTLFANLFTRYLILSQYTYKGYWEQQTGFFEKSTYLMIKPLYKFLGENEAENLCRNIFDLTLLKQLKTNLTGIRNETRKNHLQYFLNNRTSFNKKTIPVLTGQLDPTKGKIIDGDFISIDKSQSQFNNLKIVSEPKSFDSKSLDREKEEPTASWFDSYKSFTENFSKWITSFSDNELETIGITKITQNNVILIEDTDYVENPNDNQSDFSAKGLIDSTNDTTSVLYQLVREYNFSLYGQGFFNATTPFLSENDKENNYFGQYSYENRNKILLKLKEKFALPGIVQIPKITVINIGRIISIDNTFLNELAKNDKQIFIDIYNNYIQDTTIKDNIKKDLKIIENVADIQDAYDLLKSKLSKNSVIYDLMSPIYIQNNSAYTFLYPNESNGNLTGPDFFPLLLTNQNEEYNTLDTRPHFTSETETGPKVKLFLDAFIARSLNIIDQKIKDLETTEKDLNSKIKDADVKRQIYYSFKNLYDKWLADDVIIPDVNSGSKGYLEEIFLNYQDQFQFIDRTYKNIGMEMVIDIEPLIEAAKTPDTSLYTGISMLLSKNNFEFFPLPNMIVYNDKNLWTDAFKLNTFLQTINKTQFTCMYIGGYSTSKDDYLSFSNNQLNDFSNSDSVVNSFNIYYGKQNQMIFQDLKLSTTDIKETGESLALVEKIFNSSDSQTPVLKSQSLFEVYEKRGYSCEVTIPLGNTCIQPTCYFEIKNIPMFNGCYIILEVNHSIDSGSNCVKTVLKGARIGKFPPPIVQKMIVIMNGIDSGIAETIGRYSQAVKVGNQNYVNPDFKDTQNLTWFRKSTKKTLSIVRYDSNTGKFILKEN